MLSRKSMPAIRVTLLASLTFLLFVSTAIAQEGMSREEVISALKKGIVALHVIDRPEEARRMTNILEAYLNPERRRRSDREQRDPSPRSDRQLSEREVGVQHVKHMRMALEGLIAAEKIKAAETLERAIRARELRLEGRDDDEARRLIRESPERGAQIELLMYAARFLKEQGKTEKAQVVEQLADKFRRPRDSDQSREGAREGERRRDVAGEAERRGSRNVERERDPGVERRRDRERDVARERDQESREQALRDKETEEIQIQRRRILEYVAINEQVMKELQARNEEMMAEIRLQMNQLEKLKAEMRSQLKKLDGSEK